MKTIKQIFVALSIITFFTQCDETEKIEITENGDYLPLSNNTQWEYLFEYYSGIEGPRLMSDTIKYTIKGDTIIEGTSYKKIIDVNGSIVKVVRKEGGKYYGRNHELYIGFTKEYLFLDQDASVYSSWRHYKNNKTTMTEYKVVATHSTHTLNNIQFNHVMELEVNYYYREGTEFRHSYSTKHFYAKGIGEIYTYYPYPSLTYLDLSISLLKFNP